MTPKGADLDATDLIEVSTIVGGSYVTKSITGQELIDAIPLPPTGLTVGTTPISSGTIGRVLFQGTGNVLQQSSSLFWDGTNNRLGIGTSTPDTNKFLDILYNVATVGGAGVGIRNSNSTGYTELVFDNNTTPTGFGAFVFGYGGTGSGLPDTAYFFQRRNAPLIFGTNGSTRMQIHGNGNIGINTTTDAGFRLDVNGTARVSGATTMGSQLTIRYASPQLTISNAASSNKNWSLIMSGNDLYIREDGIGFPFQFKPGGNIIANQNGGNFLINTTTDAGFRLDVNGTARVAETITSNISSANWDTGTYNILNIQRNGSTRATFKTNGVFSWNSGTDFVLDSGAGSARTVLSSVSAEILAVANQAGIDYNTRLRQTSGKIAVRVLGIAGTTQNLFEVLTGASANVFQIKSDGKINMSALPTSSAGLSAGDLWNDGGTLKIV